MEINKLKQLEMINNILRLFDLYNVNYCLLRNFEFLLGETTPVESLDTVIAKSDFAKARSILLNNGFTERQQQFSRQHKAFFKLTEGLKLVSFDIQVGGVYWNDLTYLTENILKKRVKCNYFYLLSDIDFITMLITHSILGKRRFKDKYQQQLSSRLPVVEEGKILGELAGIFGETNARTILKNIKNNQFERINCKWLITCFMLKQPTRIITLLALTLRWIAQRKNPFKLSPLISFVGPDGAGKSSMVQAVKEFLQDHNRRVSAIYTGRGRENILPFTTLGRRYKRAERVNDLKVKNIPKVEKINFKRKLLYTLASPIFTFDLWLRYWLRIFPQRINSIVITDRYCSDIVLMKHVPFIFKKILLKLFPKPTLTIFLSQDAEILHSRRPEESISELERQLNIFNQFNYSFSQKTSSLEKDKREVIGFVFSYLLKNWK